VRYFSDKTKSEWIPSIAAWLGMSFALLCICLTPVDIYATSLTESLIQSKSPIFGNIKLLYMGTPTYYLSLKDRMGQFFFLSFSFLLCSDYLVLFWFWFWFFFFCTSLSSCSPIWCRNCFCLHHSTFCLFLL
jgi:hypothetical protein